MDLLVSFRWRERKIARLPVLVSYIKKFFFYSKKHFVGDTHNPRLASQNNSLRNFFLSNSLLLLLTTVPPTDCLIFGLVEMG